VLEGLYRQRDFQEAVASQSNEDRTLILSECGFCGSCGG
jgi:hypothetical protein